MAEIDISMLQNTLLSHFRRQRGRHCVPALFIVLYIIVYREIYTSPMVNRSFENNLFTVNDIDTLREVLHAAAVRSKIISDL